MRGIVGGGRGVSLGRRGRYDELFPLRPGRILRVWRVF